MRQRGSRSSGSTKSTLSRVKHMISHSWDMHLCRAITWPQQQLTCASRERGCASSLSSSCALKAPAAMRELGGAPPAEHGGAGSDVQLRCLRATLRDAGARRAALAAAVAGIGSTAVGSAAGAGSGGEAPRLDARLGLDEAAGPSGKRSSRWRWSDGWSTRPQKRAAGWRWRPRCPAGGAPWLRRGR
ncbi:unnamed protein product [Prorocentrum cordatum]|uniref:Uncharacterized protein n=1 Tax=Prorocentrum cordatum TaxID=2364126 RepID=A0ABN9VJN8_9DINO|nr:unnamed protein product [Polarella glacialis]